MAGLSEALATAQHAVGPPTRGLPEFAATLRSIDRPVSPVETGHVTTTPLRILVVEDNEDLADAVVRFLEGLGHTVRVAYSPFIAVMIAEEFVPEVAFLDLGLPGMDGYELARALRHKPGLASVRLIAMTGLDGQRKRCLELGFETHLFKPFPLDHLEKVLTSSR